MNSFNSRHQPALPGVSRRHFVQGLALGGAIAGMGLWPRLSLANQTPPILRGNQFDLEIGPSPVNITGQTTMGTLINGSLPAPTLYWREGERVTLRVTNRLPVTSSIHWHGIVLPYQMDGVPGISFPGIRPGETFVYQFDVRQAGTYWYHSHSGFQEQTGLYGAIVVEPRDRDPVQADREYTLLLSDWTDEAPMSVFTHLKQQGDYYNYYQRTTADLWRDLREKGLAQTWRERRMWNAMRMTDRDLADVTGATYTYLMNGQAPAQGFTALFKPGERVRLRFINGSAMSFFDVRIPGLKMTVVASDGQNIEPVTVDEFRIGTAETYDVVVEPQADQAYCLFAQSLDRTGFARGNLTPHPELIAPVPPMDPLPILTHMDMGMAMAGHGGMQHGSMDHSAMQQSDSHGMHHNHHAMGQPQWQLGDTEVQHAAAEFGPGVDMRAEAPRPRPEDPGVGLRDNGRRVLTHADLQHLGPAPDPREPDREIQLHLTGNMERYMWSFNGQVFSDAEPLRFKLGERLRITLVNDTMMHHPIHLHGMWSDVETGAASDRLPRKHTVSVKPSEMVHYRVTVDAPGSWAYHCHLLYHMEAGMFRKVVVQ